MTPCKPRYKLGDYVQAGFRTGTVDIWRHTRRAIDNPLLVEEDGPVYQLRRWYQQFYVDGRRRGAGYGGPLSSSNWTPPRPL